MTSQRAKRIVASLVDQNPHSRWQHYECWVQVQSLWKVLGRSPASLHTRSAGHMHTLLSMPVKFPWKQHDFGKMSTFQFTYRRERATECKSIEQGFKKRNRFYQSKQLRHSSWAGWRTPDDAFQGVMHSTFAVLTCSDVQKLEVFFFLGLIKEVLGGEEEWVVMTWTLYLPAKNSNENMTKCPAAVQICLKIFNRLCFS